MERPPPPRPPPGYAPPSQKCVPCLDISKTMAVPSYSRYGDLKLFQNARIFLNDLPVHGSRRVSFACKAISINNRKNPDFSRQNKGFSRGKSRRNQNIDNTEDLEETDLSSSKNGPMLSLSSNQRYQATATPGQREQDIVELFRKVQKQLRERAAIKEEKKIEASQQERGTVDSLLKLLRKHSVDQKKKVGLGKDINYDQSETSNSFQDDQKPNFLESSTINSEEVCAPGDTPLSRPASNFRRKSPVPRVKFQPIYSAKESMNSHSSLKSEENEKTGVTEPDLELLSLVEQDEVFSDDPSESTDMEETYDGTVGLSDMVNTDLSSLKLSELKDLAKTRGIKGYSKLKKGELVNLLSRNGP